MSMNYQAFAEYVQKELHNNSSWRDRYNRYAELLLQNEARIKEQRQRFRRSSVLYPYLSIGRVGKENILFNLRFLGQSVGDIRVDSDDVYLEISEDQAKNSQAYFGCTDESFTTAGVYRWAKTTSATIRNDFIKRLKDSKCFPRQREHMVESALFSELEKSDGRTKALRWIQPISYAGTRIHMKTAVTASKAKDDIITVPEGGGGEIDLFCRRKAGKYSYLTIIEIKDENKKSESPEKAVKQAIAYAVFIRELIRSNSGNKWMKIWGVDHQHWQEGVTLNAVIAMPKKSGDDLSFAGKEIKVGDDKIKLHYIAFLGDKKPRDGEHIDFETSL